MQTLRNHSDLSVEFKDVPTEKQKRGRWHPYLSILVIKTHFQRRMLIFAALSRPRCVNGQAGPLGPAGPGDWPRRRPPSATRSSPAGRLLPFSMRVNGVQRHGAHTGGHRVSTTSAQAGAEDRRVRGVSRDVRACARAAWGRAVRQKKADA